MGENIEVKDVQKTEYLDKNGLDMLWAKVKENTHNQVEGECNRAQAVEGDIANKLDNLKYMPYVSKTNMNSSELGDFVKYQLGATEFIISAQHGSNDAITEFSFGEVDFISRSKDSSVNIDCECVTVGNDNNIKLTNTGIRKYINRHNPAGSATEAFSTDGGVIDTTAFALKSELDSYAKKTDIPEVDTSDFVSKTGPEDQVINSILGVTGGGIQVFNGAVDDSNEGAALTPTKLEFGYANNRSTILLRGSEVDGQNGSNITIKTDLENPYIKLSDGTDDDHTGGDTLTITNEGISSTDNNANHVYATNGSIADLTQYAKKSEIAAGGTNDFVSKTATDAQIIKSELTVKDNLRVAHDSTNEWFTNINYDGISVVGNDGKDVYINQNDGIKVAASIDPNNIYSKTYFNMIYLHDYENSLRIGLDSIKALRYIEHNHNQPDTLFILSEQGVSLYNGDNNHVLTSGGSTIDITQYALKSELPTVPTKTSELQNDSEFITKSVYDEKTAALEARIAALEAKHAEAA